MHIFDIMQVHLQEGHFLGPNNTPFEGEDALVLIHHRTRKPADEAETTSHTRTSFGKGPHLSWWGWRVGMASAKRQQQRSGNLQTQQQTRGSTPEDWRWQLEDPSFWWRQVRLLFSVWWARSFLGRQGRRDDRQDVMRRSGPVLPAGLVDYGVKRQHSSKTHTVSWKRRTMNSRTHGRARGQYMEMGRGGKWGWLGLASILQGKW